MDEVVQMEKIVDHWRRKIRRLSGSKPMEQAKMNCELLLGRSFGKGG